MDALVPQKQPAQAFRQPAPKSNVVDETGTVQLVMEPYTLYIDNDEVSAMGRLLFQHESI